MDRLSRKLRTKAKAGELTCGYCGKNDNPNFICDPEIGPAMRLNHACFSCAYWLVNVLKKDDPGSVRINGTQYWIGEKTDGPAEWKGMGGTQFTIKFKNGRVVNTDNLWRNGEVPDFVKASLPDNAEFIND